jgi:hypothetical protein
VASSATKVPTICPGSLARTTIRRYLQARGCLSWKPWLLTSDQGD